MDSRQALSNSRAVRDARAGIRVIASMAMVMAAALPATADAGSAALIGPSAHGVVKLGERLQADLTGECADAHTFVRTTLGNAVVEGHGVTGCQPELTVPDEADLGAMGWVDGDPVALSVVSGDDAVPLTYSRIEPATAVVVSGAPTVVPNVSDPLGGRTGLAMRTGDVIDLGPVDLTNLQSVDVRNLSSGTGSWELRVGSAGGRAIARGRFGSLGSLFSAGDSGWYHSVAQLEFRPGVLGDANTFVDLTPNVGQAPLVFLAVTSVLASEPVVVNWIDLDGQGVAMPHRFSHDRDFTTIFDGSSFDGWSHVGPGRFVLAQGAMRAEHDLQDRGWAWLWYTRAQYSDFVLRLRFRIETYEDNGGVLLRHVDPQGDPNRATFSADEVQIQEDFENLTGGIAHVKDATRLATGVVGQWNDLEVVSVGALYIVRINGHEVNRYATTHAVRGFIAVENEQLAGTNGGHLWYDDIRVHPCDQDDDLCR